MPRPSSPGTAAGAVALATGAILADLAARGGSYDLVDRQTIAVLLWWLTGLAALIAPHGPRAPLRAGVLATAFGAGIAVWIAIDLGSSISAERSVTELARATTHLAPLVLIGWILPARLWRAVIIGATLGAVGICIAALGDRLSPGLLGQTPTVVFTNTSARLTNPMGYWNAVGSWCVMTALLLLAIASHAPGRVIRAVAIAPLPAIVVTAYLTFSRSAIASLLLGLVVLFVLARNRWTYCAVAVGAAAASAFAVSVAAGKPQIAEATGGAGAGAVVVALVVAGLALGALAALGASLDRLRMPASTGRRVAMATIAVGAIVAVVGVAEFGPRAWRQFNTPEQIAGPATGARLTTLNTTRAGQWRVALDEFSAHPWSGSGAGTFEFVNNQNSDTAEFVRDAHNAFIEALAEQGLIGFLMLLGLVLSGVWVVANAVQANALGLDRGLVAGAGAGLAAFTFGTAIDWFWEVTALAMLALALLAALIAAGRETKPVPRGGRTWPARTAVAVIALVAIAVQLPGLVGTSEVRRSQQQVQAGDLAAARSEANKAIDTMPWASSPFLQRALVDERAGAWKASIAGLHLAIKRDPQDWRLPLVLARVEAKAGHQDEALAAYRAAKRLRPNGQFFQ